MTPRPRHAKRGGCAHREDQSRDKPGKGVKALERRRSQDRDAKPVDQRLLCALLAPAGVVALLDVVSDVLRR